MEELVQIRTATGSFFTRGKDQYLLQQIFIKF